MSVPKPPDATTLDEKSMKKHQKINQEVDTHMSNVEEEYRDTDVNDIEEAFEYDEVLALASESSSGRANVIVIFYIK